MSENISTQVNKLRTCGFVWSFDWPLNHKSLWERVSVCVWKRCHVAQRCFQKTWVRCFSTAKIDCVHLYLYRRHWVRLSGVWILIQTPEEDICSWFCLGTWELFSPESRNPISALQIESSKQRWNNKQKQTVQAQGNRLYLVNPPRTPHESNTIEMIVRLHFSYSGLLCINISDYYT